MKSPAPSVPTRFNRCSRPATSRRVLALVACLAPLAAATSPAATSPAAHPPASPGSYQLHPDLELSLFAQEPDVVDPVALAFDEFGRAYVIEMRDYPYGFGPDRQPGGTVRLLEDTDGDGRADRSVVFAEGLSYPTSVIAWEGGVLVMAPPEILFLKDTDADGRADRREVVLGGLKLGVTDSNANGLRWAFDNWVHAVNGGNGGTVQSPRSKQEPIRLGNRDFRFKPDSGSIELTAHTGGGFGLVFDDWGRSFTPHNVNHVQQRIVDADALGRSPGLPAIETTHSISDHGDMARIYAISTAVTRPNHPEQAGFFSSAGSMGYLGHRGWPGDLPGSVLVCDVVGNLVHRDLLSPDGPILKASRAASEQTREFFASRDPHFRPTGVELGPDGALYLLDMQREVIEHPDYIPRNRLAALDLRAGQDRGRIYRLAPKGWPKARELPGKTPPKEWVPMLASSNQWTRLTAQRLLVSRRDPSVLPELQRLASGPDPLGRLHALWTWNALGTLPEARILRALDDPHPALRASAVSLAAEDFSDSRAVHTSLVQRVSDPAAPVRFAALTALGAFPHRPPLAPILDTLWKDRATPWMRRAALAALWPDDELLAVPVWLLDPAIATASDPGTLDAMRELADLIGARPQAADGSRLETPLNLVLGRTGVSSGVRLAFLEGLTSGLTRAGHRPTLPDAGVASLRAALDPRQPLLMATAWRLARICQIPDSDAQKATLAAAARVARDTSAPLQTRAEAVRLVDLADLAVSSPVLLALLDGREPLALQQAALDLLRQHREPTVGEGLVRAWPGLSPSLRAPVVNLLVYRHAFHPPLLAALESGALQMGELNLDLEHRRQLLRQASPGIRTRAAQFMTDDEYSNRKSAVDAWLAKLPPTGDAARGRPHFERVCAQCHRVGTLGFQVGPDLTGVGHRSVEDLLSNILDPNMAMNPAYVAFTADLDDGESETGILLAETSDAITLVQAGERRVPIPRTRLKRLRSEGKSLMPDGLEAGLTPADLRDLIAFLQEPPATP